MGARAWMAGRLPGATERREQVTAYRAWWDAANEVALTTPGPRWVALGDSAAQGIGASRPERGWVGVVLDRLRAERDPSWQVVNLSVTGARAADLLAQQVPALGALAGPRPALVTCLIGGNDLLRARGDAFLAGLTRLLGTLPEGAVVATMPRGVRENLAQRANALVTDLAAERGLVVADLWARTGPPWKGRYAADQFHPSVLGHIDWADAVAVAIGLSVAHPDRGGA
ncbi:MAG: GDSL-type esterase/lipase family protein [Acidimicrobiales bacterium]